MLLLDGLGSSRIRERANALTQLEDINFGSTSVRSSLTRDIFLNLIEALSQVLDREMAIYRRTSSNAQSEMRIIKASHLLKVVVSTITKLPKLISRFRQKHYDLILRCLTNCLTVQEDILEVVLSSAIINCVQSLNMLFAVQDFKDHLSVARYESVISVTLDALDSLVTGNEEQLTHSFEEADAMPLQSTDMADGVLFTELLTLFREFISPKSTASLTLFANSNTPAAVDNYYLRITSILARYSNSRLKKARRESRACTVIISIVNRCLLDLSTLDVKLCFRLTRIASGILLNLKAITFPHLIKQAVLFLFLSADFLFLHDFPKLPGDNWNIDTRGNLQQTSESESDLQINRTIDQSNVSSNTTSDISFDHSDIVLAPRSSLTNDTSFNPSTSSSSPDSANSEINQSIKQIRALIMLFYEVIHSSMSTFGENDLQTVLFESSRSLPAEPFDLVYIRLLNPDSQLLWLSRITMIKLLKVYFEAKSHTESTSHAESTEWIKRRHIEGTYFADRQKFVLMLSETSHLSEFLVEMVNWCSRSTYIGLLGTQLITLGTTFFATFGPTNRSHADAILEMLKSHSELKHALMSSIKSQDKSVKYWSLLALYVLIRLTTDFGSAINFSAYEAIILDINKYFELAFELFKDQKLCRPACSVICVLFPLIKRLKGIKEFEFVFRKPVLQQLEAAISLSEVSGPYQVCKESALFWFYAYFICKDCRFSSIRFGNEIADNNMHTGQLFSRLLGRWILMKESQIAGLKDTDDIELASLLLRWAEGESVKISKLLFDHTPISMRFSGKQSKENSILSTSCFDYQVKSLLREFSLLHRKTKLDHKFKLQSDTEISDIPELVTEAKVTENIKSSLENQSGQSFSSTYNFVRLISGINLPANSNIKTDDITESQNFPEVGAADPKKLLSFVNAINQLSMSNVDHPKHLFRSVDPLGIAKRLIQNGGMLEKHESNTQQDEEDTQMVDAMFTEQHHEFEATANADSTKVYNYKILMTSPSLEMKIVKFLFKMRFICGYDLSAAMDKCLTSIASETSTLRSLAFYFQIELELESIQQNPKIADGVVEKLLSGLMDLLQQHQTKTYELSVWVMCRLFSRFAKEWITSKNITFREDCLEVGQYFSLLHDKGMLYTDMEVCEFGSYCFSMIECMYELEMTDEIVDSELFTLDKMLAKGCTCFTELNNFGKVALTPLMSSLIKKCPFEGRLLLYNQFIDAFRQPQKSIESSSTFNYFLSMMSTTSDSLTLSAVCHLLEFSQYKQSKRYLSYSIQDVVDLNKLGNIDKFFHNFKVFIFKCWRSFELPLQDFPFEIFGYSDFKALVVSNIEELTAIALSCDDKHAIEHISKITGKHPRDIVKDSISLCIPLAWTNDGTEMRIFETLESFMKKTHTKSAIKEQLPLILLEGIRLCDCSSEMDLKEAIEKRYQTECLQLGNTEAATFKFQSSMCDEAYKEMGLLIEPSKLLRLWDELTTFTSTKQSWNIQTIHFILIRILFLLDHSLLVSERKGFLRKVLIVIWIHPALCVHAFVCQKVMETVIGFLKVPELRMDVSNLILALILCAIKFEKDLLGDLLISVVAELFTIHEKDPELVNIANGILKIVGRVSLDEDNLVLRVAVKGIKNYLGIETDIDTQSIINVLMNTMGNYKWILQVVSHLLPTAILLTINPGESIRQKFVDRVYQIHVEYSDYLTPKFKTWIGYIIGKYYSETGRVPTFENCEFDKRLFEYYSNPEFESKAKRLDILFIRMAEQSNLQANLKSIILFEQISGQILYQKDKSELIEGFMNYKEVFSKVEPYIYPMNEYTNHLARNRLGMSSNVPFKEFLEGLLPALNALMNRMSFEEWIQRIVLALINNFSNRSSIAVALESYVSYIPNVSKSFFAPLVIHYVENEPAKRGRQISSMINTFFGNDTSVLTKEAVDLFLEVVLLIRVGAKRREPKFVNVFRLLNHCEIYKAALSVGKPKTALMLLEEYYEDGISSVKDTSERNRKQKRKVQESNDGWKKSEYTFLTKVYTSLDEDDLFFGLPTRPDLECGSNYVCHNGKRSGEVMLDNATFEMALSSGNSVDLISNTSKKLALDMLHLGYSGISSALGGYSDHESNHSDIAASNSINAAVYERSWKLSKWDLPTPSHPNSEHQSIYKALKVLHDNDGTNVNDCCWKSIREILDARDEFIRQATCIGSKAFSAWCRTLAFACNTTDIMELNSSKEMATYVNKLSKSVSWMLKQDAEGSESLILGRKISYELAGKFCEASLKNEAAIGVMNEMHCYGKLMRCKGEAQKSLNAAVWLNRFAEQQTTGSERNARAFIQRVAKFDMAAAFWAQGEETRFPVEILKQLVNEDIPTASGIKTPMLTKGLLNAYIATWSNQSRQETPEDIMNEYIGKGQQVMNVEEQQRAGESLEHDVDIIRRNTLSKTYSMFGQFCDGELQSGDLDMKIVKLRKSCRRLERDLEQVERYMQENILGKAGSRLGPDERKKAKRNARKEHSRLKLRSKMEMGELREACDNRRNYVVKAIEFYLKAVAAGGNTDLESEIDRFCGLWLENSDVLINRSVLNAVPAYQFVSWTNQLSSRLLEEKSTFQSTLGELLVRVCLRHPFHCLYQMKSLRMRGESGDAASQSRGRAAERLWKTLAKYHKKFWVKRGSTEGKVVQLGDGDILGSIDSLCETAAEMARTHIGTAGKSVRMASIPGGEWWLNVLPGRFVPSPVSRLSVEKVSAYEVGKMAVIADVIPKVTTATSGLSRPKVLTVILSTGEKQKILIKGGSDDLRQDAIMEQVFEKVNRLLERDDETRRRGIRIRTYRVVSLGPGSGMIEFVRNSVALYEILRRLHEGDPMRIDEARAKMKEVQTESTQERLEVFEEIVRSIPPALGRFFLDNFSFPDTWYKARMLYSRGIAATSIVGHILGLGDRHCNNILIDRSTGEPVHIDLGVAFDQGKYLPIPENVPFRLTRDIIAGLGITGVEGLFSKGCEHVFRVLRSHSQYICGILNVLKYDPLYSWTLSPLRIQQLQHLQGGNIPLDRLLGRDTGSEANLAIGVVQKKLEADGLSDEAAVRVLIRDATDPLNLATIYMGWCPFL